uniref:Homeostatic iron regulator n=1 Tax=Sus scrofa TaxID=9823 RepID=A0A8D1EXT6_PIG
GAALEKTKIRIPAALAMAPGPRRGHRPLGVQMRFPAGPSPPASRLVTKNSVRSDIAGMAVEKIALAALGRDVEDGEGRIKSSLREIKSLGLNLFQRGSGAGAALKSKKTKPEPERGGAPRPGSAPHCPLGLMQFKKSPKGPKADRRQREVRLEARRPVRKLPRTSRSSPVPSQRASPFNDRLRFPQRGVPIVAQWLTNPTSYTDRK